MNVKISHTHTAVGWDVLIEVTTEKGEIITHVKTRINGFTEDDQNVNPPAKGWQTTLTQKGVYPGNNDVLVTVTDGGGEQTNWVSRWS